MTSRSTEDYDRGEKLSHYRQLESLRVVLIVSHRSRRVTVIERQGSGEASGWAERDVRGGETITLDLHQASLPVDAVYEGIELDPV